VTCIVDLTAVANPASCGRR